MKHVSSSLVFLIEKKKVGKYVYCSRFDFIILFFLARFCRFFVYWKMSCKFLSHAVTLPSSAWLFPSATLSDSCSSYVLLLFCGFSDLSLRLIPISRRCCRVEEETKNRKTTEGKGDHTNKQKTERYNAGVAPLCTHTYQFFPPQITSKNANNDSISF